ncbi:MAG: hypothetical protein ACXWLR_10790 [Myxococcales bacterium]
MRLERSTASVAAIALLAACGQPADRCDAVETAIVTSYSQSPCSSPVSVCTVGSTASGTLAGTTQFTALSMAQGPSPDAVLYSGDLVITTPSGTITLRDHGLLNSSTGYYLEMQEVVSGTGAYDQSSGLLLSQGVATCTGFQGGLNGSICGVH